MSESLRVYLNTQTGKPVAFDTIDGPNEKRMALFKARMKGLLRYAQDQHSIIYLLTLTVGNPDKVDIRMLNKFMTHLRWRFSQRHQPFRYVWVLEPQLQRYGDTGILAPHWHIAIACRPQALPNVIYRSTAPTGQRYDLITDGLTVTQRELYRWWGYGQMLCQPARGPVTAYMAKYMSKNLTAEAFFGHRFGSSFMSWWKFPQWAFDVLLMFWTASLDIMHARIVTGETGRDLRFRVTDGASMDIYKVTSPYVRVCA